MGLLTSQENQRIRDKFVPVTDISPQVAMQSWIPHKHCSTAGHQPLALPSLLLFIPGQPRMTTA